jgi:hypothetical protein
VDSCPKVSVLDGAPVSDAIDFWSLAGALQYITFTRPDISYVIQCNTLGVKLAFALHFMSISIIYALTFMKSKVSFHVNA